MPSPAGRTLLVQQWPSGVAGNWETEMLGHSEWARARVLSAWTSLLTSQTDTILQLRQCVQGAPTSLPDLPPLTFPVRVLRGSEKESGVSSLRRAPPPSLGQEGPGWIGGRAGIWNQAQPWGQPSRRPTWPPLLGPLFFPLFGLVCPQFPRKFALGETPAGWSQLKQECTTALSHSGLLLALPPLSWQAGLEGRGRGAGSVSGEE